MKDKKEIEVITMQAMWDVYIDDEFVDDFIDFTATAIGQTTLESGNFGYESYTEEEIYDVVYNTVTKLLRG